jgi:hypothetical protein
MQVIYDYNIAYAIAKPIIEKTDPIQFPPRKIQYPNQLYSPKWEMSVDALENTLTYIFNSIHHACYMVCIENYKIKMYKLDGTTTAPDVKKSLDKIFSKKLYGENYMNEKQQNILNIISDNRNNIRLMQCILKTFPDKKTRPNTIDVNEYAELLQNKTLPLSNGVFIFNLTDAVILREDGNPPFPLISKTLSSKEYKSQYNFSSHIPIFSGSGQRGYMDIPIPTYDDILYVLGKSNITSIRDIYTPWNDKTIDRAIFRGGPAGCGYTPETNGRLKIAELSKKHPTYINAKITGSGQNTVRFDPKYGLGMMNPIATDKKNFVPMNEQGKYKYIVHIDGNVLAYRLLMTMATESLILRADSPYVSWVDHEIRPFEHYIPIKADLSDLVEVIGWCRKNDVLCQRIAKRGYLFARNALTRKYITNTLLNLMGEFMGQPPLSLSVSNTPSSSPPPSPSPSLPSPPPRSVSISNTPPYPPSPPSPPSPPPPPLQSVSVSNTPSTPPNMRQRKTKKCPHGYSYLFNTKMIPKKSATSKTMMLSPSSPPASSPSSPPSSPPSSASASKKLKRCPRGERRNRKTKKCEKK